MSYTSTTLATLRTRLAERYESTPFWTTQDATDAINEALRMFNLYTGYWRGSANVLTTANTVFYSVATTLTYRTRIFRAGRPLTRKSIVELYRQRRNWRTQTTASGGEVPTTVQEWAPVGLTTFAIWPAHAAGGLTLTVEAVKVTPTLVNVGDFVDLGDEEQDLLLDEAIWILTFKRPSEKAAQEARHLSFLQGCLERNDQLRASSYFRKRLGLDVQKRMLPPKSKQDPDDEQLQQLGGA